MKFQSIRIAKSTLHGAIAISEDTLAEIVRKAQECCYSLFPQYDLSLEYHRVWLWNVYDQDRSKTRLKCWELMCLAKALGVSWSAVCKDLGVEALGWGEIPE